MKELITKLSRLSSGQRYIIDRILLAIDEGYLYAYVPELTDSQMEWLSSNNIDFIYKNDLEEWEIQVP